jgi:muramoyltetrapeptide carboxypeptidase
MTIPWRVPSAVRPGDVVRIVAPCGAFDRERFAAGVAIIERAGLVARYDDAVFSKHRYLAGDDERRLGELRHALGESDTRVLWVARGGYGATRLLPRLPVDAVRRADKWLVGFSDTTALHMLWARAGLASLHGANVTTLAQWSEGARDELMAWLTSPAPRLFKGRIVHRGELVSGRLLGGNLTVLAAMAGTGLLPPLRGAIVLLEDVGERPYRLDRVLTQLVQAGALDGIVGVVVGQLTDCAEPNADYTALDVLTDVLAPLGVPVLAELPIGHEPSSRAVLSGAVATLDTHEGVLTLRGADASVSV